MRTPDKLKEIERSVHSTTCDWGCPAGSYKVPCSPVFEGYAKDELASRCGR
uniref:U2266p n=1 Tax=Mycobacterium leprae TaxID=1769 RepID=Q50051_MYCLR|nr:u2266p [Mycobacterium leprae]